MTTSSERADMDGFFNDAFFTIKMFCYFMFVTIIGTLVYLLCFQEEKHRRVERQLLERQQMYFHGSGSVIQNPIYVDVRERPQSLATYGL